MTTKVPATLTLDSREVAEMLGKAHAHLLRDIDTYGQYFDESKIGLVDFFIESCYKDSKGEERKKYLITKKGCEFLAHKMTGKKGALFTATYINRFHEMEAKLKEVSAARPLAIPQLRCKYFRREPVITLLDLERLVGCNHATLLYGLKRYMIPYRMLTKGDLWAYREENNEFVCNSRLIVVAKEEVLQLLERMGRHSKENIAAVNYFQEIASRQVANAELIIKQLSVLHKAGNMLQDLSERDMVGKFITAGLMSLGLFDPADYPAPEHVATMDINSAPGWNKGGILLHAQHLINRGEAVTKENLKAFEQNLFTRLER